MVAEWAGMLKGMQIGGWRYHEKKVQGVAILGVLGNQIPFTYILFRSAVYSLRYHPF